MITRSDDPLADFARWDYEQAEEEKRYPTCDCCGDTITDETFYRIRYKGRTIIVCCGCAEECYTEDYIEED